MGDTGSGKSRLIQSWHARNTFRVSLYWNPENEPVAGIRAQTPADVQRLISKGHRKIHFVPSRDTQEQRAELEQIRAILERIGDKLRAGRHEVPVWCLFFVDEVRWVAPKGDRDGPAVWLATMVRKRGVWCVFASQRPAGVSHDVLSQCRTVVMFRPGPWDGPYFKDYKVPIEEFQSHLAKKYHFVVYQPPDWSLCKPIRV